MKFILQDKEIKLTNQLLGGYSLALDSDEGEKISYMLTFPGLTGVSLEFFNLPDWLSYDDTTKKLSGTPTGNNAGKIVLKFKVTHSSGEYNDELEVKIKSTIVLGEGTKTTFTLPIFDQLKTHADLSDNLIGDSTYGNPGIKLNLMDLSGTEFFDLSKNDLSNNWFFNDEDWKTSIGDTLYYEVVMDGKKVPKSGNWVTFDNGVLKFEPTTSHVGIHKITINAYDIDGLMAVKTKVISVTVEDVNVTQRTDIADIKIKEGYTGNFTLPEFAELLTDMDLSDNVINGNTIDLSLNDLSNNGLWDLSKNDLSGNWTFFDSDFGTHKGDKLYYTAAINGEQIPEENNWITFSKGKLSYSPTHKHVGVHKITIKTTDLLGNESKFEFSLTVESTHIENELKDKEMFTGEVLEFQLPEFKDMINDLSDNIFTTKEGDKTFYGLDLSLNDLSNNGLWDLSKNDLSSNDLSGNWNFFDPDFGTHKGDKVLYKAYINDKLIEDHLHRSEGQFITFKNGVLKFMPLHNDNGTYTIKIVTTDLSGNETVQEFKLKVKSKSIRSDIEDMKVDEGKTLEYTLPEFKALAADNDLSDNLIYKDGKWGLDLSLNDLSDNKLWDLSKNDLSDNDLSWNFFDPDFGTNKGDITMYEVKINGSLMPEKNYWATFNKGKFTFNPTGKNIGDHTITITTTDLSGNVTEQTFKLTVNAVETPYVRSKFSGNTIGIKTKYSMKDTEQLTFTLPEFESAAKFRRSTTAYHKNFNGDYGIEAFPGDFKEYDTPEDLTDKWVFFNPQWRTASGGDHLYYTAKINGVTIPSENNWITFKNGKFDFNPQNENAGNYDIILYAYDLNSNYTSITLNLDVIDTFAPVITLNGKLSLTHEAGTDYNDEGGKAIDIVDGEVDLVRINNIDTKKLGMQTVKFEAVDAAGNKATAERKVIVADTTAPEIILNGELSVKHEAGAKYVDKGGKAHDIFDGDVDLVITKNIDVNVAGIQLVEFEAVDKAGNKATAVRQVKVVDSTAPVITLNGKLTDNHHEAGTKYTDKGGKAFDSFNGDVDLVKINDIDVHKLGIQILKFEAVDAAGNRAVAEREVIVVDTTAPVIKLFGEKELTLRYGTEYVEPGVYAIDSFDGEVSVTTNSDVDMSKVGSYKVIYSASDSSGNTSNSVRTVLVIDDLAPLIEMLGVTEIILEQDSVYTDPGAIAIDGLESEVEVVVDNKVDTSKAGVYYVTYSATDSRGNTTKAVRTVIITSAEAPVIRVFGDMHVTIRERDLYVDAGAEAHDNSDGKVEVAVNNTVDTTKPGVYEVTYTAVDSLGHEAVEKRIVTVVANNLPILGDIQLVLTTNELFEVVIPVKDNDADKVTLSVSELPTWLSFNEVTNVLSGTPSHDDEGNYTIAVHADDGRTKVVTREYNLIVIRVCESGTVSFDKGITKDISEYGDNTDFVKSVNLKFVNMDAKCVGLVYVAYETGNGGKVVDFEFSDEYKDFLVEMEVVTSFKPMFFKYKGNRMLKLTEMKEMSTYEPNRWASEKILKEDYDSGEVVETHKTVFQGYFRDLHMNTGCVDEDFDAGICEDPHILTFGGNRLDLPHNDRIYTMINGLGLKINVKCQIIGEGSYAKYFYVNYQGEDFIIDIDDLNIKQSANRVKTKYHMLESIDYSGNNFVFEKQMRTLIIRSTDGVMKLVFNAETRGLLINSRLNFTQENSTGVMMSNYADECELTELTQ